jgi:hypothetical protein
MLDQRMLEEISKCADLYLALKAKGLSADEASTLFKIVFDGVISIEAIKATGVRPR